MKRFLSLLSCLVLIFTCTIQPLIIDASGEANVVITSGGETVTAEDNKGWSYTVPINANNRAMYPSSNIREFSATYDNSGDYIDMQEFFDKLCFADTVNNNAVKPCAYSVKCYNNTTKELIQSVDSLSDLKIRKIGSYKIEYSVSADGYNTYSDEFLFNVVSKEGGQRAYMELSKDSIYIPPSSAPVLLKVYTDYNIGTNGTISLKVADRNKVYGFISKNKEEEDCWNIMLFGGGTQGETTVSINCNGSSVYLPSSIKLSVYSGYQKATLIATPKPTATSTPIPTATMIPTATSTTKPTATSIPTATSTPIPTATSTPIPTATSTPIPTATSKPKPTEAKANVNKSDSYISVGKSNYTKVQGDKPFNIVSVTNSDSAVFYVSSNTKVVKVNDGKVTIVGSGIANIVLTTNETCNYKATSRIVKVVVKPKKTTINSVKSSKKNSIYVTYKKVTGVSYYKLQYSTSKTFKNCKTVKLKSTVTSKTIKGLKSGKKYYVRIRAYKNTDNKVLNSNWSNVKSVKVK